MSRLPDNVVRTIERTCNKYNSRYDNRIPKEAFGPALNEIAWEHRDEGFGLSEKLWEKHVPFLDTYVAEDILQKPNGDHWDVFNGAQPGQPLKPGQIYHGKVGPNRAWIAPVEPANYSDSKPEPEPVKPPVNPLPSDGDLVDAGYKLEDYYRNKLNRPDRGTPVDVLGYARWLGFDYIFSRQQGMNHEQALEAMFKNITNITGIPR